MGNHPIEGLMLTAMNSIESMIDVNTIVGEPIETSNGIIIIPISKVCFGFAAGGSEFKGETIDEYVKNDKDEKVQYKLPFGGGSGATVSINPIAFLIVEEGKVKLLPVNHTSCLDKILDYVPDLFEKIAQSANKLTETTSKKDKKQEEKENLNKIPKTVEVKLKYNPIKLKKQEDKLMAEELEEIFETGYDEE